MVEDPLAEIDEANVVVEDYDSDDEDDYDEKEPSCGGNAGAVKKNEDEAAASSSSDSPHYRELLVQLYCALGSKFLPRLLRTTSKAGDEASWVYQSLALNIISTFSIHPVENMPTFFSSVNFTHFFTHPPPLRPGNQQGLRRTSPRYSRRSS